MKITEFFDSQKRESQRLVDELAAHEATSPAMMAELTELDQQCIELAARLSAEQLAQSPKAISTEADLIQLRRKRDAIKHRFTLVRDDLHRRLETITRPLIEKHADRWLELARSLPDRYHCRQQQIIDQRGNVRCYQVEHNNAALIAAKDKILAARKGIIGMLHCSISDIEKEVQAFERQYELIDFDTLEVTEVTSAAEAKKFAPEAEGGDMDRGTQMPDGKIHVHPKPADPQIKNLANRISKLEAQL
jgi:hypothetical protein